MTAGSFAGVACFFLWAWLLLIMGTLLGGRLFGLPWSFVAVEKESWSLLTEPEIYHSEPTGSTGPWSNDREALICACEITPKLQDWPVRLRSSPPEHRPRWSWSLPLRQKQASSPWMGQGQAFAARSRDSPEFSDCRNWICLPHHGQKRIPRKSTLERPLRFGKMLTSRPGPLALSMNVPKERSLLATDLNSSRGSLHQLVCPEGEPVLSTVLCDAPVSISQAVLEFADVSRNTRQSQFFDSMIRGTLETCPIRHCAVECEIRKVERMQTLAHAG